MNPEDRYICRGGGSDKKGPFRGQKTKLKNQEIKADIGSMKNNKGSLKSPNTKAYRNVICI